MDNGIRPTSFVVDTGRVFPAEVDAPTPARSPSRPVLVVGTEGANWKRAFDIVASSFLIAALSPLFLAISCVLLLSGGDIVFRQNRVGRNGVAFECFKFRTMVRNADVALINILKRDRLRREEWNNYQKLANDPRITRVGRFLRKTSLDELPQLINVLKGEMSLVGPRPVTASELVRYGRAVRWYFSVRPGMTGLWQVSRRPKTTYAERVAMDAYYARNHSLALDSWILLRTIPASIQNDAGN